MFEICVRRRFPARHGLRNFKGEDEPLHEHQWFFEVTVAAKGLDESGCAMDFHEVDRAIEKTIAPFVGKSFNDIPPFTHTSPSAEAIAHSFFRTLSETLNTATSHVTRVTVGEDEDHRASTTE